MYTDCLSPCQINSFYGAQLSVSLLSDTGMDSGKFNTLPLISQTCSIAERSGDFGDWWRPILASWFPNCTELSVYTFVYSCGDVQKWEPNGECMKKPKTSFQWFSYAFQSLEVFLNRYVGTKSLKGRSWRYVAPLRRVSSSKFTVYLSPCHVSIDKLGQVYTYAYNSLIAMNLSK